jgi:hypothetical protein
VGCSASVLYVDAAVEETATCKSHHGVSLAGSWTCHRRRFCAGDDADFAAETVRDDVFWLLGSCSLNPTWNDLAF